MTLRDTDDIRRRMRNSFERPTGARFSDINPQRTRVFPDIGATLPLLKPTTTERPNITRPRQLPMSATVEPVQPRTVAPLVATAAPATQAVPLRRSTKAKRRRIITRKRIVLSIVAILVACCAWFGVKFISNIQKVFHGSLFSILTTTKLKGEDSGRVNILLAGNSSDDPGHDGANLTDSIMEISIDVKNNTAYLISIPRDLWVDIPGYGHAKINEAYEDGQVHGFSASGYASGGMGLLEEVVQQNLGIQSDYYALIDYSALKDAVDTVGGVNFVVNSSDPRGLYDPSIDYATHGPLVRLSNGTHHLNGEQALDLSRARGDAPGSYGFPRADFDRTQHQRELLLDLESKVLTVGTLANPITVSNLFDTFSKNVDTDFMLGDVRRLYDIGKGIKSNNIQSVGLDNVNGTGYLASYMASNGEDALIPAAGLDNFTNIQALLARLMTNNPIVREGAKVVVLNGTNTSGLAAKAQTTLRSKDVDVASIADASTTSATTTIIDASGGKMPATLTLLKQLYGSEVTTTNPYANVYTADFIVILGADQVPAAPSSSPPAQ